MSSIILRQGKIAVATYLKTNITHLAVGRGNWTTTPDVPSFEASGLIDEIGRVPVTSADYLVEDGEGTIEHDGKTWSVTATPTNTIQIIGVIPINVIVGEEVAEAAFFGDGVSVTGGGYQPVANVSVAGRLFFLENLVGVPIEADQIFTRKLRLTL